MKKILLIILASGLHAGMAQTLLNLDSLLRLLPAARPDTQQVHLLIQIGQQYETNSPETARHYYAKAGKLSEQLHYRTGTLSYIHNYTFVLNILGEYDSSLLLNLRGVELAKAMGDSLNMGKALFNAGTSLKLKGNIEEAAAYYLQGQQVFERFGNRAIDARVCDMLQILYSDMRQYGRAIAFGERSIALARSLHDSLILVSALSNVGMSYNALGRHEKAMAGYQEGLAIARNIRSGYAECTLHLNIGDLLLSQGKLDSLQPYYTRALELSRAVEDREAEVVALRGMAIYHLGMRQTGEALRLANASLHLADSLRMRPQRHKTLRTLANIHFALQDMAQAESFANQAAGLADSLSSEALQRHVAGLEKKYESAKKDALLKVQQAAIHEQNLINYGLATLVLLLVAIGGLGFRTYRQQQRLQHQRIQELETEKQLSAAEAVLRGEAQERSRLARDLHDGLGGSLSGVKFSLQRLRGQVVLGAEFQQDFERALDMLDNSISEMRRVARNMMPESLLNLGLEAALRDFCNDINASGRLQVSFQAQGLENPRLSQPESIAIYRIVQELLTNSMKHAAATEVLVQVYLHPDRVSITVEDNGKGMGPGNAPENEGMGWSNIRSRVAYFKGQVDVQSAPGEGTSVYVEWPFG